MKTKNSSFEEPVLCDSSSGLRGKIFSSAVFCKFSSQQTVLTNCDFFPSVFVVVQDKKFYIYLQCGCLVEM